MTMTMTMTMSELGLQAAQCRRRDRRLEPEKLTSTLKSRARALGESKDFKNAKQVLLDWAEEASSNHPGRNDNNQYNHGMTSKAEAAAGSSARTSGRPSSAEAGTNLFKE